MTSVTSPALVSFLTRVTPTKAESPKDMTPVDFAQLIVHFAPALTKELCFDAEAPAGSHIKSLTTVLKEVTTQQPGLKYSNLTPQGIATKDPKMLSQLSDAIYRMSLKTPFPKTYNAKNERNRLMRRHSSVGAAAPAGGGNKRPLSEMTKQNENTANAAGNVSDAGCAGGSSSGAARRAAAMKGKIVHTSLTDTSSAQPAVSAVAQSGGQRVVGTDPSDYTVCAACQKSEPWKQYIWPLPTVDMSKSSPAASPTTANPPSATTTASAALASAAQIVDCSSSTSNSSSPAPLSLIYSNYLYTIQRQYLAMLDAGLETPMAMAIISRHLEEGLPAHLHPKE